MNVARLVHISKIKMWNMLALRAKAEAGWVLAYPAVLSGFLFFRHFKKISTELFPEYGNKKRQRIVLFPTGLVSRTGNSQFENRIP
uniref:Uncharacterized protein n=1 Tax=Candidatus Kentrum sp. LFY TaxID=2126342 RepID=A0A450WUQ9_9GAMM|nr:MAG: hypothetical protein BECKLFY1418C_GA0070996_107814 [Candidatus Kentron sp. LFY]